MKTLQFLILYLLPLVFPSCGFAQYQLDDPIIFEPVAGYPSKSITSFAQDQEGFTWISTRNGLRRFDGLVFEDFFHDPNDSTSISNDNINSISINNKTGEVWIGHKKGVSVYQPDKKVFKNYIHNFQKHRNRIPSGEVAEVLVDQAGDIWVGYVNRGLAKYRKETDDFEKINTGLFYANDIQEDIDDKNTIWVATKYGLARIDKSSNKAVYLYGGNHIDDYSTVVSSFCQMKNGKIYLESRSNKILEFDKESHSVIEINPIIKDTLILQAGVRIIKSTPTSPNNPILSVYRQSDYEFWINSRYGTVLYNVLSKSVIYARYQSKKHPFNVNFIDDQNRIWSGKGRLSMAIFNPTVQQSCEVTELSIAGYIENRYGPKRIIYDSIRNQIFAIFRPTTGIYILDLNTNTVKKIPPPPNERLLSNEAKIHARDMLLLQDGSLLILAYEHLYLYKNGFKILKKLPASLKPAAKGMKKILQDREGTIWVSGLDTICKIDLKSEEVVSYPIDGHHLAEDQTGDIWVTSHDGLHTYKKDLNQFVSQDYECGKTKVCSDPIWVDKDGIVWILSDQRRLAFLNSKSLNSKIRYYGKKEGLALTNISKFIPYKDQFILFGKNKIQFFNRTTRKFGTSYHFGSSFDEPVSDATLLSDGRIACLTHEKNILFFHPDSLKTTRELIKPYLTQLKVNGIDRSTRLDTPEKKTLSLKHDETFFSVSYSTLGYDYPDKIQTRYQLKGFDQKWRLGQPNQDINYKNMPSGHYQFLVEVFNSSGVRYERQLVDIHIARPWWQSLWFKAMIIGSVLAVISLLYRSRIANVRKEERLKASVKQQVADAEMAALRAQMNPHFIFNSLNSIDYYIIKEDQETASDYLNRFSRLIRLVLMNSKSESVPLKNDLDAIKLYIELEVLRFNQAFDFEIDIAPNLDLEKTSIPPMLIQPYVENAIWHGLMQLEDRKGALSLSLYIEGDFLICQIEDNGIGRTASMALKSKTGTDRKSFGMKITKDRIEMMNTLSKTKAEVAIIDLTDSKGQASGTRVELKIPLTISENEIAK